jgi:hypothetical protein
MPPVKISYQYQFSGDVRVDKNVACLSSLVYLLLRSTLKQHSASIVVVAVVVNIFYSHLLFIFITLCVSHRSTENREFCLGIPVSFHRKC